MVDYCDVTLTLDNIHNYYVFFFERKEFPNRSESAKNELTSEFYTRATAAGFFPAPIMDDTGLA